MAAPQPRVAVIILNFNKKADVLACLESVSHWDNANNYIVVVDNGSIDGSADAVAEQFPQVHLVRNRENLGAPGGRNAGIRYARENLDFDHVLFLDNDTVVDKAFLARLLAAVADDPKAGIVCGKAYTAYPSTVLMSAGIRVNLYTGAIYDLGNGDPDRGQLDAGGYVDACGAFGFLITKQALAQVGGFSEALNPYGWEDVDLCLRVRRYGYRCLYVPDAIIYHKGTKLGRGPIAGYERNKVKHYLVVLAWHTSTLQKVSCALCFPVRALMVVGRLIRQGHFSIVLAQLHGFWQGLSRARKPPVANGEGV